jgi:hypothetical protein
VSVQISSGLRNILTAGFTYNGDPADPAYFERMRRRLSDDEIPRAVCDQVCGHEGSYGFDQHMTDLLVGDFERWLTARNAPDTAQLDRLTNAMLNGSSRNELLDFCDILGLEDARIPTTRYGNLDEALLAMAGPELGKALRRTVQRWGRLGYFERGIPQAKIDSTPRDRRREPADKLRSFTPNREQLRP